MRRGIFTVTSAAVVFFVVSLAITKARVSTAPAQEAKPVVFKADLTLAQEVPAPAPTTPGTAIGTGVFLLSADRTKLEYAIAFTGLSGPPTAAHFHAAAFVGTATGVVKLICGGGGPPCPASSAGFITGTWSSSDSQQPLNSSRVDDLLQGRVYVNIHTALNPPGEIRRQVIPISTP